MTTMKKLLAVLVLVASPVVAQPSISSSSTASKNKTATFANLGAPLDSSVRYCSDCAATSPCTGSGTGAFAYRVAGAWNCTTGGGGAGGATLSANTFIDTQTITPSASTAAALSITRATTGTGTIATTNGSGSIVGTGTKFMSQLRANDIITPTGQSALTVAIVTDDTHVTTYSGASATASGIGYALSALTQTIDANGAFLLPPSSPYGGLTSGGRNEVWGEGAYLTAGSDTCTILGGDAHTTAANTRATLVGYNALGISQSTAIGAYTQASGDSATGIGNGVTASGTGAVAVGNAASASGNFSLAIGNGATCADANTACFGSHGGPFTTVRWGGDKLDTSPPTVNHVTSAGSGTDIAGGDLNVTLGAGTGAASGGSWKVSTVPTTQTTGTTLNTGAVDRLAIRAKAIALTSGSASSIVTMSLPTLTALGGQVSGTIVATNATDVQSLPVLIVWNAVNKGGVYTTQTKEIAAATCACSTGTLTVATSVTTGTNQVTLKITPTTSLTATSFKFYYTIQNNAEVAVASFF